MCCLSRAVILSFFLLSGLLPNVCPPTLQSGKWTFDPEDECWRRLVVSTKEQQSLHYPSHQVSYRVSDPHGSALI
jgi:hypothetical protein